MPLRTFSPQDLRSQRVEGHPIAGPMKREPPEWHEPLVVGNPFCEGGEEVNSYTSALMNCNLAGT